MFIEKKWLTTEDPNVVFEADTSVGRLKKQLWDASDEETVAFHRDDLHPGRRQWFDCHNDNRCEDR